MPHREEFRAVLEAAGGGTFVTIPFDVEQVFGRKRLPVRATIDGEEYRGSLVRMGGPCHMLLVRKDIREKLGKGPGDEVSITVEEDLEPRVVEVPTDLAQALEQDAAAAAYFDKLSFSHRKEYVEWITDAKREETRRKRVAKAVEMLREGKKAR